MYNIRFLKILLSFYNHVFILCSMYVVLCINLHITYTAACVIYVFIICIAYMTIYCMYCMHIICTVGIAFIVCTFNVMNVVYVLYALTVCTAYSFLCTLRIVCIF